MDNIANFCAEISSKNFSVDSIFRETTRVETILYYLDEEQKNAVIAELKKLDRERFYTSITNLTQLYPLSRNLLLEMLDEFEKIDHYMVDGFDLSELLLNHMQSIFKELRTANGGPLTKKAVDYNKEIEKLIKEKSKYEKQKQSNIAKIKEYDKLKAEVENLRIQCDEKRLAENTQNYADRKRQLEERINRIKKEEADSKKDIQALTREIENHKNKLTQERDKELLRELLKSLPSDVEEE